VAVVVIREHDEHSLRREECRLAMRDPFDRVGDGGADFAHAGELCSLIQLRSRSSHPLSLPFGHSTIYSVPSGGGHHTLRPSHHSGIYWASPGGRPLMKSVSFSLALLLSISPTAFAESGLLFRTPAMNGTHIVFSYAGDLWSVPRSGGHAERLTSSPGTEIRPIFSPDGSMIAFTGEYDGNVDVYAISATGGEPKRLTYHPGPDVAVAWTPDGKKILF